MPDGRVIDIQARLQPKKAEESGDGEVAVRDPRVDGEQHFLLAFGMRFCSVLVGCLLLGGMTGGLASDIPVEDENTITPSEEPGEVATVLQALERAPREGSGHFALHPANTTSPRDTIISFIKLTQRLYDLIESPEYSIEDRIEVKHLFEEMEEFFDLRDVAPSLREKMASASGIYLREIIDRVGLPPIEVIPTELEMRNAMEAGYPGRWQLPELPFEIIRVDSGADEGKYLFSNETLERVKPLFQEIRHLPYKANAAEDFYEFYFLTPNPIIPREWIDALPGWAHEDYFEQTVWQWISMVIVLILAGVSVWLLRLLIQRVFGGRRNALRHLAWLLVPAWAIGVAYLAYDLIMDKIFISGEVLEGVTYLFYAVVLLSALVMTFMFGTVFADLVTGSHRMWRRTFDAHLARIGIRIVSLTLCVIILIEGLQEVGFSLTTVIAGAGVTGLAVALAAQSTLRNIFGSLMLLLDKPFRVGQRIAVHGYDGVVEEIGLRSTKLRLLTGHVTSIPNERMADAEIENIGRRPYIRRVTNLSIAYGTPLKKVHRAVDIIREILTPAEINQPEFPPQVYFNEFDDDSLNILIMYWYHPPEYWDYLAFNQRINTTIMERFEEEGIEFALPAQRIQVAREEAIVPSDE